jgi:hypothetical protein
VTTAKDSAVISFLIRLLQNVSHPLNLLLIQIVSIVLSSKLVASLVSKIGQQSDVKGADLGEVAERILAVELGPG